MTKVTNTLAGFALAVAAGAVNATPPKDNGGCKTNCGGTTTPVAGNQTTDVTVGNTINIDNNPSATSSSTSSSGVVIQPGAIKGGNSSSDATAINGGNKLDNKNTNIGGSQTTIVESKRNAPPAIGPAMPMQAGVAVVGGGKLTEESAVLLCARAPKSGSVWSGGLSTTVGGVSLGRTPGVEGIDGALIEKTIKDENGVEQKVVAKSSCVEAVMAEQGQMRVHASGEAGQALVVANDIHKSPELQSRLADVRSVAHCDGNPTTNMIMGTCPTVPTQVSETVKNFTAASSGVVVPQREVCPANTVRAGKPALWSEQIQKYICG